jgi:enterochelin esterase-like enzyme
MPMTMESVIARETKELESLFLKRTVKLDCFLPSGVASPQHLELLLINDGQDLEQMGFHAMLEEMYAKKEIRPVACIGIHASEDRRMEYGTAGVPDYKGRGAKAELYTKFILQELLPYIYETWLIPPACRKAFAGFSMGALSALDIAWHHPSQFNTVGVFSGSLWWRRKSLDDGYNEDTDRIMHQLIRSGRYSESLKFFVQSGTEDESADRNNNGIIDSIDDALALIDELEKKGYKRDKDVVYFELEGGKHDVPTWGKAMPVFLKWAYALVTGC